MLLNEHYPSDIRVLKESRTLIENGYDITLMCLARNGEEQKETVDGMNVIRLKGSETKQKKGILDILIAVFRINPLFLRALNEYLRKDQFSIIHVHDLPLFFTAQKAAKAEVKVVLDFHENYPDALSVWFKWRKNFLIRLKNKIFFGYKRWHKMELDAAMSCDCLITVVHEMKDRLQREAQVPEEKISIVSNMEGKDFLEQSVDESIFKHYEGKFIVAYTGNVGPHRGVDTLVKSMIYLKDQGDIILLVIGSCSLDTQHHLERLIKENRLEGKVELWGYRPFNQFFSFMNMASVNVIPHNKTGHTDHTIPHKLYQAMMVGRPVLVSSCKPLKRVVETNQSGLVFLAGDSKDLSDKILTLYEDKVQYQALAENGRKATVEGYLNWEKEQQKLLELYDKLLV